MAYSAGQPVIDVIKLGYRANLPVLLEGPHGTGKSSMLKESAEQLGIGFITRDLSIMEPPDLVGIPIVAEGQTQYAPPSFLPTEGQGIFGLEELNRCPKHMQAPCLELLTSRRLNDYKLPAGWLPMVAINPFNDEYFDTEELDAALISRFLRIEVKPSIEQWAKWARGTGLCERLVCFVEQSPESLGSNAPSPRSWAYANGVLEAWREHGDNNLDLLVGGLEGVIGDTWAVAFVQYLHQSTAPLSEVDIRENYFAHRAVVQRWVADKKLDVIKASLDALKRYLQPQRTYKKVIGNSLEKRNIEAFFGDLPAEFRRQVADWLQDRGFGELAIED